MIFAFSGLASCGECSATITAEQHTKKYKNGNSQTFIYYRCTKKLGVCSQSSYSPQSELSDQVREIVASCGLHSGWEEIFEKWAQEKIIKERLDSESIFQKLQSDLTELDTRLNRLLDAYLDQVIEPGIYKEKKNELFEEKLGLQEKLAKMKDSGNSWLEPMREIVFSPLAWAKVARAKNNDHELAFMAKTVGSNFSLGNRRLSTARKTGFSDLAAVRGAASHPPAPASFSLLVRPEGFEPPT